MSLAVNRPGFACEPAGEPSGQQHGSDGQRDGRVEDIEILYHATSSNTA
jgi:hypothetical protein